MSHSSRSLTVTGEMKPPLLDSELLNQIEQGMELTVLIFVIEMV